MFIKERAFVFLVDRILISLLSCFCYWLGGGFVEYISCLIRGLDYVEVGSSAWSLEIC